MAGKIFDFTSFFSVWPGLFKNILARCVSISREIFDYYVFLKDG